MLENQLPNGKTIIVKIGTDALTNADGLPDKGVIDALVEQIVALRVAGNKLLLVTSGAVGLGRKAAGFTSTQKLTDVQKSVAASIGQPKLMRAYEDAFLRHGFNEPAQILLENIHFQNGEGRKTFCEKVEHLFKKAAARVCAKVPFLRRFKPYFENGKNGNQSRWNLLETLNHLFDHTPNVIPIVNENDVLSRLEIKPLGADEAVFSDNDGLASLIGRLVNADHLVTVSTHAVHAQNPLENRHAKLVPFVNLGSRIISLEGQGIDTSGKSNGGSGGMTNKLATTCAFLQESKALCGRRTAHIISRASMLSKGILRALSGEPVGTQLICYRSNAHKARAAGTNAACVCGG